MVRFAVAAGQAGPAGKAMKKKIQNLDHFIVDTFFAEIAPTIAFGRKEGHLPAGYLERTAVSHENGPEGW
jgi:hypothetical protein